MTVDRVIMIASHPGSVARLAQPIARAGMAVEAWSPYGSRLGYSRYVRRHRDLCADPAQRREQLSSIAREVGPGDWVILGTDDDIYEASDLAQDDPDVTSLLPGKHHRSALGGKAEMAGTLDHLGIQQPRWTAAHSRADVRAAAAMVGGWAMVKTVRGAGGRGVWRVDAAVEPREISGAGPYLVQEWIEGVTTSIDIVVVNGRVALAPYSEMVEVSRSYGVSLVRRYTAMADERLSADLDRLAAGLGGTWLANLTAMRQPDGTHVLVEVDMRPNAWHSYLDRLGFPMPRVLEAIRGGGEVPHQAPSLTPQVRVVNVNRVLKAAIAGSPRQARHLLAPNASWRYANRGDAGLTYREARDLARWLVLTRAGRRRPPA